MFYCRVYNRILRPGLALLTPKAAQPGSEMRRRFIAMNNTINTFCDNVKLAA